MGAHYRGTRHPLVRIPPLDCPEAGKSDFLTPLSFTPRKRPQGRTGALWRLPPASCLSQGFPSQLQASLSAVPASPHLSRKHVLAISLHPRHRHLIVPDSAVVFQMRPPLEALWRGDSTKGPLRKSDGSPWLPSLQHLIRHVCGCVLLAGWPTSAPAD